MFQRILDLLTSELLQAFHDIIEGQIEGKLLQIFHNKPQTALEIVAVSIFSPLFDDHFYNIIPLIRCLPLKATVQQLSTQQGPRMVPDQVHILKSSALVAFIHHPHLFPPFLCKQFNATKNYGIVHLCVTPGRLYVNTNQYSSQPRYYDDHDHEDADADTIG